MAGIVHSRSKNGVASLAYAIAIIKAPPCLRKDIVTRTSSARYALAPIFDSVPDKSFEMLLRCMYQSSAVRIANSSARFTWP